MAFEENIHILGGKGDRVSFQKVRRKNRRKTRERLKTTPIEDLDEVMPSHQKRAHAFDLNGKGLSNIALFRWFDSQIGKLWQDVLTELHRRVSSRTANGRILLQRIIPPWINKNSFCQRYFVDDEGIFCKRTYDRKPRLSREARLPQLDEVELWLDGKLILRRGNQLFWAVKVLSGTRMIKLYDFSQKKDVLQVIQTFSFRQDRPLSCDDLKYFKSLIKENQEEVLSRFEAKLDERKRSQIA